MSKLSEWNDELKRGQAEIDSKYDVKWTNGFGNIRWSSVDEYSCWINEAKENKMTRDEALVKITNVWYKGGNLIDQLEALGLMKFEEKRTSLQIIHSNLDFYEGSTQQAMKIEQELKEAGYLK